MQANSVFNVPEGTSVFGLGNSVDLPLVAKEKLNHDTYIFKFGLPPTKTFGVPIGAHVKFIAFIDGQGKVGRSYTPISDV